MSEENQKIGKSKISVVNETRLGVYVWELPNGKILGNDEGDILSIDSYYGDLTRVSILCREAKALGFEDGKPIFWAGQHKCSDDDWYEHMRELYNEGALG